MKTTGVEHVFREAVAISKHEILLPYWCVVNSDSNQVGKSRVTQHRSLVDTIRIKMDGCSAFKTLAEGKDGKTCGRGYVNLFGTLQICISIPSSGLLRGFLGIMPSAGVYSSGTPCTYTCWDVQLYKGRGVLEERWWYSSTTVRD